MLAKLSSFIKNRNSVKKPDLNIFSNKTMLGEQIKKTIVQVEDDFELLDLMISDQKSAPVIFHATARWRKYSENLILFIKNNGLTDFRRIKDRDGEGARGLRSFGATDLFPNSPEYQSERLINHTKFAVTGSAAKKIENLSNSLVGNPEGFEYYGNFYCLTWLNFYFRYAYASRFIDFKNQVIVEIGPGSGKQAEMLKKAHPDLTILLFDIPPQLYICNQYLEKVFPNEVIGYKETRIFKSFADIEKGKINILPNWQIPLLQNQKFDLLWNAASFQEMSPEVVKFYMENCQGAKNLYLQYALKNPHKEVGEKQSIHQDYLGNFKEADCEIASHPYAVENWGYFDSFWANCKTE